MHPFHEIFPESDEPITTLVLSRRSGRIPKGSYRFLECYCTAPGCDCRRVSLVVVNEKAREKAVISFGFDQKGAADGPHLETARRQAPYASELLDLFVEALNSGPEWLERLYRQYRRVREAVDGKPYRGRGFPGFGRRKYRALAPPDLEAVLERSLQELAAGRSPSGGRSGSCQAGAPRATSRGRKPASPSDAAARGIGALVARYARLGTLGRLSELEAAREELRRYLLADEGAPDELAALLPALCQQSPENDEGIAAALRLLYDTLCLFQQELAERRPGARLRMENLQGALARRVFLENEDFDLCAAVTGTLAQSGVEILPVLREANTSMLRAGAARSDLQHPPGEEAMAGIASCLESMMLASPFEGAQALLELFALNEPELQTALTAEMLGAKSPMLREVSALMLFNPDAEVRLGVSRLLAALEGGRVTRETLRRLIVSRNWFPDEIKQNVDQAIGNARRARVDCAPLPKAPSLKVFASPIDGSGAQSFQVLLSDGKKRCSCSILLKQGEGVADAFVASFRSKRELDDFLEHLAKEAFFIASSEGHLERRVCQALADGARRGNVPTFWLVRIAELLGTGRWIARALDPSLELSQLRRELEASSPRLLGQEEYRLSLEETGQWHRYEPIFASWFEEDYSLHQEIEASRGRRKGISAGAALARIVGTVLEKRRELWLERLVLLTLWLKSGRRVPFAWHQMFHLATAVADRSIALKEIPFMVAVAQLTLDAYLERLEGGAPPSPETARPRA